LKSTAERNMRLLTTRKREMTVGLRFGNYSAVIINRIGRKHKENEL